MENEDEHQSSLVQTSDVRIDIPSIEKTSSYSMVVGDECFRDNTPRGRGTEEVLSESVQLSLSFHVAHSKRTDLRKHENYLALARDPNLLSEQELGPASKLQCDMNHLLVLLRRKLMEMGFSQHSTFEVTNDQKRVDVEIEELISSSSADRHPFVSQILNQQHCTLCNCSANAHTMSNGTDGVPEQWYRQQCKCIVDLLVSYRQLRKKLILENEETCPICFQIYQEESEIYSLKCQHFACKTCLVKYVTFNLENGNLLRMSCPMKGCSMLFAQSNIQQLVDDQLLERFERYYEIYAVNADPNLRYCCNDVCGIILKKEDTDELFVVCTQCETKTCWDCGAKWHPRIECDKYEGVTFQRWAKAHGVKKCPHCSAYFEQEEDDMCKHVTCTVCNYNWCWECQQRIKIHHFDPSHPDCCPVIRYPKWKQRLAKARQRAAYCICAPCIFILWPGTFLTREFVPQIEKAKDYFKAFICFLVSILLLPLFYVVVLAVLIVTCLRASLRKHTGPKSPRDQQTRTRISRMQRRVNGGGG
mmetsp:Transcript_25360/g.29011  ORF Transcript_25360/g.29011 Transcript_25360/m.29011 type:complete len:531 (-) Transcript_25360:366-1958(-)